MPTPSSAPTASRSSATTTRIDAFDRESVALDESIAAIRSGKLLDGLLERNPGDEMGWFWNIAELPELPHAGHLAQVLAQHEFQEAFKNYRDLRFLDRNLQGWADKLGVFDDMLANRRQAYAERLPKVRAAGAQDRAASRRCRSGATTLAAELDTRRSRSRRRGLRRRRSSATLLARWPNMRAVARARGQRPRSRRRRASACAAWPAR